MAVTALDPALVAALLGILAAGVGAARCSRRAPEAEDLAGPWASRGWLDALSSVERQEARASEVARRTLGADVWTAFMRDGYIDLPSAAEPRTHYRLRLARRVEIRAGGLAASRSWDRGCTRAYLCVYPQYELPAVEFLAHLYLRLRDDEQRVLATGRLQPGDGPIPNVF